MKNVSKLPLKKLRTLPITSLVITNETSPIIYYSKSYGHKMTGNFDLKKIAQERYPLFLIIMETSVTAQRKVHIGTHTHTPNKYSVK